MEDTKNTSKELTTGGPEETKNKAGATETSSRAIPWAALMTLVIGAFMSILDSSIVNVALPKLMSVFGVSEDSIEWVATSYLLVSGIVVPITGYLCDRFGNKRMYIFCLSVFTLGSGLCALSWSNNTLIIARVIQAIGGGMIMPVSMGMIYTIVPLERIGLAMGIWGISAMAAPAIGPTMGGFLVDHMGWEWIFTVNLPVGILAVIISGIVLKESPCRSNLKLDIVGSMLSTVTCFSALLALSQGQSKGWTSYYIVILFVISIFALALFIIWELNTSNPLIDLRILKNKTLCITLSGYSLTIVGLYSAVFLIPLFAQNILGYTPMQTGILMFPSAVVTGLMMPVSGRLFDKIGALPLCFSGLTIVAISTYQLHNIDLNISFTHLQLMLAERALGLGLCMMPLSTAGMNTVPRFLVARASALNNLIRSLAASLGIAYLTYVLMSRQIFHEAMLSQSVTYSSPGTIMALIKIGALTGKPGEGGFSTNSLMVIAGLIQRQSYVAAIADAFVISSVAVAIAIPFTLFLSKKAVEDEAKRQIRQFNHLAPAKADMLASAQVIPGE